MSLIKRLGFQVTLHANYAYSPFELNVLTLCYNQILHHTVVPPSYSLPSFLLPSLHPTPFPPSYSLPSILLPTLLPTPYSLLSILYSDLSFLLPSLYHTPFPTSKSLPYVLKNITFFLLPFFLPTPFPPSYFLLPTP